MVFHVVNVCSVYVIKCLWQMLIAILLRKKKKNIILCTYGTRLLWNVIQKDAIDMRKFHKIFEECYDKQPVDMSSKSRNSIWQEIKNCNFISTNKKNFRKVYALVHAYYAHYTMEFNWYTNISQYFCEISFYVDMVRLQITNLLVKLKVHEIRRKMQISSTNICTCII